MLVRSAGRRQRHHTAKALAASFEQLHLPWLAPAQLRWHERRASRKTATTTQPRKRTDRSVPSAARNGQLRRLATAAELPIPPASGHYPPLFPNAFRNASQDKNIPFVHDSGPQLARIRPFVNPIVLNTSVATPPPSTRVSHGVHGTSVQLLQHLHIAIQVGRLSRVKAILNRLTETCTPHSPELLYAHTAYLESSLKALALKGRGADAAKQLGAMQRWFEVEIKNNGLRVDPKMLVIMIRAAISGLTGKRRDRTIRRYAAMATGLGEDMYDDVLYSDDYDDNEFTILGRVTSDFYEGRHEEQVEPKEDVKVESTRSSQPPHMQGLGVDDIPEIVATDLRGEGLASIKRTLQDFQARPPLPADALEEERREQAVERQRVLEETAVEVAIERWRKADDDLRRIGISTVMQTKSIAALLWQWYKSLLPALEAERAECRRLLSEPEKMDHERYHYGPYLELLPLEKVAANTIMYTMGKANAGKSRSTDGWDEAGLRVGQLTMGLAKAIEQEHNVVAASGQATSKKAIGRKALKHALWKLAKKNGKSEPQPTAEEDRQALLSQLKWPTDVKVRFGAMLITKLMESATLPVTRTHPRTHEKITQVQPAFLHRSKYVRGKKIGTLDLNPALMEKLKSEPLGGLIAKRMPMVVEPRPWSGWNAGGYLCYSNPVIRMSAGDKSSKDYFLAAHSKGDMDQVYAGLTTLGEVPWKIHQGVFKVQVEAWNSGEAVANLAPLNPDLELPPEPEPSDDPVPRRRWFAEVREIENRRAGLHSNRCFQNFQMEVARTMVNETLYFPHNLDFRGRAYPIPPYLNHMGADNVRALLVFANGKELGPEGLRWLKIHLATVAGHDKASMEERVQFTMEHIDDIYDSVRNPLGGGRWWLQSEDAWQTLAACFELTQAMDSPDPSKFVSHLPIQQDGTCNGLQHYAALGGDKIGAAQVNLEPGDRPSDVYTAVAEAVKEEVRKDAELGNPIAQKLDGKITRKCVKQPVMTNVYGVTWFGAKEQVHKQLEVIFPNVRKYDDVNLMNMSQYIATKIFKTLGTMFGGAQAIQRWLGQCADRISTCITPAQIAELSAPKQTVPKKKGSRAAEKPRTPPQPPAPPGSSFGDRRQGKDAQPLFKSTVIWTTPLRLPVVQPYREEGKRIVVTGLQQIQLSEPEVWHPVSKRKQLQAFPPNFIHSLDATHMLLSALKCKERGITFASVHDSFWTHACDIKEMSGILRDAFIEMHGDDIIARLREEFETRYKGCMYLASVYAMSKAGKKITALRKEKGLKGFHEIAVESERMRLLASESAADRAKGEAMVTPGSIMASEGDELALATPSEVMSQQLGALPPSAKKANAEAAAAAKVDAGATLSDADESAEAALPPTPAELEEADAMATGPVDAEAEADVAFEMTNADADFSPSPDEVAEDDADAETSASSAMEQGSGKKRARTRRGTAKSTLTRKLYVWMPVTFPEVPQKGDFDVTRLRDSRYFFH